jgi:hypothetical protein
MKHSFIAMLAIVAVLSSQRVNGQAPVAREIIEQLTERLFKQAGEQELRELTAMGGETAVRQLLEQSSREGGEQLLKKVTQYGMEDGPIALRVIRRAPGKMVEALEGMPPELRVAGMRAVERNPDVMMPLVLKYGSSAMEMAARHPGVGEILVHELGSDGINLGRKLTTQQAILAARHADQIAMLPPAERTAVVAKIEETPGILQFLERHPRILLTTAGVTTVLALKDDIVGDLGMPTIGRDGQVNIPSRPGLIDRLFASLAQFLARPVLVLAVALAIGIMGWFVVHLWGKWRMQQLRWAQQRGADQIKAGTQTQRQNEIAHGSKS